MSNDRPTLKDVARVAGVSVTTASYVLSYQAGGNIRISDETRERVWQAARSLDYHPNLAARHIRTGQSGLIGFISDEVASTPFAVNIIRGAQHAASKNGKTLFVINTERDRQAEKQAIAALLERRVEGIVYATMYHRIIQPRQSFSKVPTVLVDCFCEDRSLPSIAPDETQGGRLATEVLLAKGHRCIGFINVDFERHARAAQGRLDGYRQALAAYGVPYTDDLVRAGNTMADSGYLHARSLLDLPVRPTALFCGTDRMAMGAYDAVKEAGLRIPDDVAIVGFDNQELIAAYLRPALSTIALPHYEMGRWAIEHLLEHDQLPPEGQAQVQIACPYIERHSV